MLEDNIWSLLGMLAVCVVILILAHYAAKWVAIHGTAGYSASDKSSELQILRQMSVGKAQRIVLVKLCDRCLLLGICENNISLITELTAEEAGKFFSHDETDPKTQPGFMETLQKYWQKKK